MTKGYRARILADSISPNGDRLTTFEVRFPRFVLAEFNTHRMLSKNSASTRAIPLEKQIRIVQEDPVLPVEWGRNQAGMSAKKLLSPEEQVEAERLWLELRDKAIEQVRALSTIGPVQEDGKQGVHKQLAGRLLESWMWQTVIVSGTEWSNFFALRCDPDNAQPEICKIANMIRELYEDNEPVQLEAGDWHLPLIYPEDIEIAKEQFGADYRDVLLKVSTGRCARVSYLTHDNKRDLNADIKLHDMLVQNGHMSPCEHVARPMSSVEIRRVELLTRQTETMYAGHINDSGEITVIERAPKQGNDWMEHQLGFAGNFKGWLSLFKKSYCLYLAKKLFMC